ncbi:MAG TPA: enoyl-CoA hydratase/isomerase family protein [Caulobacteraceae bacterium]|jgi:enoyl-CoA hydratase|nr:enoyl-CoA hydratase/isomerase family protein [Caulobacteraceae bacterium]
MPDPEVIVAVHGRVGRLTLNRPGALNALTTGMVALMTQALLAWREDAAISAVLIDHAGERGFCAGGDIRFLAASAAEGGAAACEFFFTEYRLNHLLFTYPKTVIAIMDGITMGGGVGISTPADYRIGTERTAFAMPETGIGLFPDVGGGWYLPRLHGATGAWLALTGAKLKAADCELLGITTDVVESKDVPAVTAAILADPDDIEEILTAAEWDPGPVTLAAHRDQIDGLFAHDTVEVILAALAADGSDWALAQLAILKTKSPLSMKTALRQIRAGAVMTDFADNMAMEMRIAARIVVSHDFAEGVRAVIVVKDNAPKWSPATLDEVTEAMLDAVFAPLPADQEWSPL